MDSHTTFRQVVGNLLPLEATKITRLLDKKNKDLFRCAIKTF